MARKYKAVLPESIAREKAWKKELERRKAATKARKKREAEKLKREHEKEREKLKKKKAKEKEKQKKKERIEREKEKKKLSKQRAEARYQRRLAKIRQEREQYKEEHKEEIEAKKHLREAEKEKARLIRLAEKSLEDARLKEEKERAKKKAKAEKVAKEKRKARNHRYYLKKRKKELKSIANKKYYDSHKRLKILQKHIDTNDIPGSFRIVIAQDGVIKSAKIKSQWWNYAIEKYNEFVEENHSNILCPSEEITSSSKPTATTVREILLLKHVNPEVEDNISVFRDEYGRAVTVKTDNEEWAIVRKEPWYVEEKFIVPNLNPYNSKKDARWICENFIENNLSIGNMKKIFLWGNYVIINGDEGFDFVVGRTVNAAVNLYMALFKKYENTEYIYFIGELDISLVSKWTEKIREKTGWENLKRGKRTYYTKGASSEDVEITKSIPTSSKSTNSVSSKSSGRR